MPRIRQATVDDLELVCAMRVAFLAEQRGILPTALPSAFVEETRAFLERRQRAGTLRSWLAEEEGGRCVGVVSVLLLEMPPRPDDARTGEGYVVNLYVEASARRRGVGAALLDACVASAEPADVRRLFLHATDDGRPLYASRGFEANDAWMELRL